MKFLLCIVLVYFSRCDGFAAPKRTRHVGTLTQAEHQPFERQPQSAWQKTTLPSLVGIFLWTASAVLFPFELELNQHAISRAATPIIQLHRPAASALTNEQQLVADVWKEVTRQYFDTSYNGLGEDGWRQKRLDAVKKVTDIGPADSPQKQEQVYAAIRTMLSALNDPYTRFLTPEQYESLTVYAKGSNVGGIGVSLIVDNSGRVVVAQVSPGSPAENSGVEAGDVIVEIDGVDIACNGATAEYVAAKCRGEAGSNLNLAVQHASNKKVTNLTLTRAKIKNNPVQVSTITVDNQKVGLLKVTAFSQETVSQIVEALRDVSKQRVSAIAIDLRGNVGGYMPAGVDVAKLFLPPKARIISEVDKSGRATIYLADGVGSETEKPLYLLVDKRTASASEILAAALQDNHRATVVGSSATFGKGRIQNVQALEDGSGIAVTKASYLTPSGRDIQGVGVTPDKITKNCEPDDSAVACLTGLAT